ncbi:sugar ABC transporter permease [Paenibacillus sp. IB182496]|uniref:Sugar ABC transporter permease n=2 Tax=Paenibacillus sabuli TaxID=2772509 RepID=A0A927BRQ7_9BACL|nr:sugar ABC transporter permease [Paenibacillus sabuli]
MLRRSGRARRRREMLAGYLFTGPMLVGVLIFTLVPMLLSFGLSLTDWSFVTGIETIRFDGFGNFARLFATDAFANSLVHNLVLLLSVPVGMTLALALAVVITTRVYTPGLFKVIFFMPHISSIVAVAVVWQVLFHPSYGPVNSMLMALGIAEPPKWLADPSYALTSVLMLMVWIDMGVALIIYIAGLKNIPADLYEAAEIDGATSWKKFKHITFPLLTPTTFFLLITGLIGNFKSFALIKVLTDGGPVKSTTVIAYDMYTEGFVNLRTGYASSMAVVLFAVILLITLIQWIGQRKWVNY